jgi:hypothetical protein
LFAGLFCFASAGFVQKHLGLAGVAGHVLVVALVFGVFQRYGDRVTRICERHFRPLASLLFAGLAGIFVLVYPWENGKGPGRSSDRDDGLNIAVGRLLEGRSPYYPPDPRAGPLSVLPGAILLATPFAAAGNSGWQNLPWLAVLLGGLAAAGGSRGRALAWFVLLLGLSPSIQYEFISGGDMLANGIYAGAALVLAVVASAGSGYAGLRRIASWRLLAAAGFLGIALASRPNFLLLGPLAVMAAGLAGGWRAGLALGLVAGGISGGLCLGFYLADPAGFTPLVAGNKFANADLVWPWASRAATVVAVAVAFGAPLLLRFPCFRGNILRGTAALAVLVLAAPMLAGVLINSLLLGKLDFGFMHPRYGLMFLPLAAWCWLPACKTGPAAGGDPRS